MSSQKQILIIEDEETLVELLRTKLQNVGFRVFCALDGREGLKLIKEKKPDLVLLDIVMPKMNGYEVLEALHREHNHIPVIIISNSGQPVELEKTSRLGAVDHLIKTEFNPQEVLDKVNRFLDGKSEEPTKKAIPHPQPTSDKNVQQNGINVLLVEDDSFLREICSKKLLKDGYTVYTAVDGKEAIESAKTVKPDIILLDIILPSMDGFQVLSSVRSDSDKDLARTPVIMLSNLGQEDDIQKAMDLGANDYLVKAHFTTDEIAGKIKQTIKNS